MKRAWDAYREHAFGADEIQPLSNRSHNWLYLGATLVDCLDNLWIMGLKEEFAEAREWVATKLRFDGSFGISMFETSAPAMTALRNRKPSQLCASLEKAHFAQSSHHDIAYIESPRHQFHFSWPSRFFTRFISIPYSRQPALSLDCPSPQDSNSLIVLPPFRLVLTPSSASPPTWLWIVAPFIRILGGLLSAFEFSKDRLFLHKAQELADRMMFAFQKNPTGLPCTTISLSSKLCSHPAWTQARGERALAVRPNSAILAEFGTIQLEYKYLAYHTGEKKYWDVSENIMLLMRHIERPHGLFPTFINPSSGRWSTGKIAFGALGDSFYEYLIKQWLLTRKSEPYLREMWESTMLAMAKLLVQKSSPSELVYVADWTGSSLIHKMDHLACFIPAMLAVGAQDGSKYDAEFMTLADRIGETCYQMYAITRSGLSAEFVQFKPGEDMRIGLSAPYNIGR
ncbi:MAG: hypothetical protein SGPRY_001792 [Prymnesium sp.]